MKRNKLNGIILLAGASLLVFASSFRPFERDDFIKILSNNASKGGGCPMTQTGRQSAGMDAYTGSIPDGTTSSGGTYTCLGCHSGGSATPTINMTVSPAFTNNTYVPGQTYTITYNVTGSGYTGFGFDFEINDGNTSSSTTAGSFSNPSANCQVFPASAYPSNVSHNQRISSSSSATFSWTAPTNATNSLYLFSVGLGVNANGSSSGDNMASHNLVLTPASTSGIETFEMSNFDVYPNPATDLLNIQFTLNQSSMVSVDLIGINGQKVSTLVESTKYGMGDQKLNFSLSDQVSSGIYFLQVKTDQKIYRKKVIIK